MPVIEAVIFTAVFVLGTLAVCLLLLRLLLPHGQHTGAGDGALSVAQLREEAAREARARLSQGRHRTERPPLRCVHNAPSVWTEPVVALVA